MNVYTLEVKKKINLKIVKMIAEKLLHESLKL